MWFSSCKQHASSDCFFLDYCRFCKCLEYNGAGIESLLCVCSFSFHCDTLRWASSVKCYTNNACSFFQWWSDHPFLCMFLQRGTRRREIEVKWNKILLWVFWTISAYEHWTYNSSIVHFLYISKSGLFQWSHEKNCPKVEPHEALIFVYPESSTKLGIIVVQNFR